MLKILRIAFILALMLFFLISCKHRKQDVKPTLKATAGTHAKKSSKKSTGRSSATGAAETKLQQQLGLSGNEIRNSKLYSFVVDWYGVPYRYGGCKKTGVDCSCFAGLLSQTVYRSTLPRSAEQIFRSCRQVSLKHAKEGDFVFFAIGGKKISHVGIYLRDKWFVHASSSKGVVVNNLDEAYYKKYFFSAGRMKDA